MEAMPYSHLTRGTFLIATPEIDAGLYFRSVLLLCEHSASGSFALMINKPLDLELPYEVFKVEEFRNTRVQLRAGGPVQTNQMMLLHTSDSIPDQTVELVEGVYLGGDMIFLQKCVQDEAGPEMLLCFGYSGWGSGLLEREFLDGSWFLCPASRAHLFETPPQQLWQSLLREMGGKYATLSMIPEDLSLN